MLYARITIDVLTHIVYNDANHITNTHTDTHNWMDLDAFNHIQIFYNFCANV